MSTYRLRERGKMIYVASPYSHPSPAIREYRYREVEKYTADLLRARSWCYSPIVHCHNLSQRFALPFTVDYWSEYNFHMLERSDALHVLKLPGWEDSRGVQAEIRYWSSLGGVPKLVSWGEEDEQPAAGVR